MEKTQPNVVNRFLEYVKIDTTSHEAKAGEPEMFPSSGGQIVLANRLRDELNEIGLEDVTLDSHGYVTATLPSTLPKGKTAPVIGLMAHMDTSSGAPGENIVPIIHENYKGGDMNLKNGVVISPRENPELKNYVDMDIITSDGTTLLGADDKAGIAEIMTALNYFVQEGSALIHGKVRVCFNPDEEIGEGTKYFPGVSEDGFDKSVFGADMIYTMDGDGSTTLENETFNAAMARFDIVGKPVHPGYAMGKDMVDPIQVINDILNLMPKYDRPENTTDHEGYVCPMKISGDSSTGTIEKILLRDFTSEGLEDKKRILHRIEREINDQYGSGTATLNMKDQYRNMKEKLDEYPQAMALARKAMETAGLDVITKPIRGGTDGSALTLMGIPTPNVGAGGHNFHGPREFIPTANMETAVDVIIELVLAAANS